MLHLNSVYSIESITHTDEYDEVEQSYSLAGACKSFSYNMMRVVNGKTAYEQTLMKEQ